MRVQARSSGLWSAVQYLNNTKLEQSEFHNFKKELEDAGVRLIAVSKTKSKEEISRLYNWGQRDFGENYVQELVSKQSELPDDIQWHFIGHLQRNKVKEIAGFIHLIQGVDSERLLKEINKQAIRQNRTIQILLQVHIAEEGTKFGFDSEEIKTLIPHLDLYTNIQVRGLMGMATFTDDMEKVKGEFAGLSALYEACKKNLSVADWDILSMGMSSDYKTAINCGSSMIRIGTLLFGERS